MTKAYNQTVCSLTRNSNESVMIFLYLSGFSKCFQPFTVAVVKYNSVYRPARLPGYRRVWRLGSDVFGFDWKGLVGSDWCGIVLRAGYRAGVALGENTKRGGNERQLHLLPKTTGATP